MIGTGYLGQHHARIYASLDGRELIGIVEADDGRASEICEKFACQRFDSAEALAAACMDVLKSGIASSLLDEAVAPFKAEVAAKHYLEFMSVGIPSSPY